jgi:hypothetical protein
MHSTTSRRLRGVAVLLAGALALTACEDAPSGSAAASSARSSRPAVTTAAPPAATSRVEVATVASATFSGAAVDQYGEDQVQAAYAVAAAFTDEVSFNESVLGPDPDRTVGAFEFATKYMTPKMAENWRARMQKVLDGDMEEAKNMMTFCYNDTLGPDMAFPSSGPIVKDRTISNAGSLIDSRGRLIVTLDEHATMRYFRTGTLIDLAVDKTVSLSMVQQGDVWFIDSMSGEWHTGAEIPA